MKKANKNGWGGKRAGAGGKAKTALQRFAATGENRSHRKIERDVKPSPKFLEFVQRVATERESFAHRITPGQTICRNLDGSAFAWPENSAAQRMRCYAQRIVGGEIAACSLVKLAAQRFLDDLEHGAERGLFFDAIAAENILTWFSEFNARGFVLQDWQLFMVGQVFAWKLASGLRRFREVWCEVPKKSGKTFLMGGVALFMMLADQEANAEIFSAANSKDQAKLCFRSAKRILDECANLKNTVRVFYNAFTHGTSFYHPVSADGRTIDGPNVHTVLFDEVHEFRDDELFNKLTAGIVARKQPLIFTATTAGQSPSGFCWERHSYFVKLLTSVSPDDSKFVLISALDEGDDWKDEAVWAKVNLNLNVSVYADALRSQVAEIAEFPAKLTPFLRYHLNSWNTLGSTRSIPLDRLRACVGPYDLPPKELREWFLDNCFSWPAWGGFDLGIVEDMTSFVALYPEVRFDGMGPDAAPYMVAIPYFWIPEDRVAEKAKKWNVPLDSWIRDGFVRITPGDYVDQAIIKEDLKKIIRESGHFYDIGFDAWNSQVMCSELSDEKICVFTRVPQSAPYLTSPAQELLRSIVSGRFIHLGNPVLLWHLGNVILEPDEKGGIVPKKASKNEKIDGVQALLNALQRYLNPTEEQKFSRTCVYSTRGVLTI